MSRSDIIIGGLVFGLAGAVFYGGFVKRWNGQTLAETYRKKNRSIDGAFFKFALVNLLSAEDTESQDQDYTEQVEPEKEMATSG